MSEPGDLHVARILYCKFRAKRHRGPRMTTLELLTARALNETIDGSWISWAVKMLQEGHDSQSLRELAGESPPFNQFELLAIVDRTLEELALDWSDTHQVVRQYRNELLQELLAGTKSSKEVLKILKDLCIAMDNVTYLYDFYLLFFAQADLEEEEFQYYWPDADRSNIESEILKWAEKHLASANT